jgi:hypothetical protein
VEEACQTESKSDVVLLGFGTMYTCWKMPLLASTDESTWCQNPEHHHHPHRHKNIKSQSQKDLIWKCPYYVRSLKKQHRDEKWILHILHIFITVTSYKVMHIGSVQVQNPFDLAFTSQSISVYDHIKKYVYSRRPKARCSRQYLSPLMFLCHVHTSICSNNNLSKHLQYRAGDHHIVTASHLSIRNYNGFCSIMKNFWTQVVICILFIFNAFRYGIRWPSWPLPI